MNNKEPGYVYILTNPSFREDWVKIGKSSRPVDVRSIIDQLNQPYDFKKSIEEHSTSLRRSRVRINRVLML